MPRPSATSSSVQAAKQSLRPAQRGLKTVLGPRKSLRLALAYDHAFSRFQYNIGPYRKEARRLAALEGAYASKRCFIIGNGPSLNKMDLAPLRDEYTFGLNRFYLAFDRLGFSTSFLLCANRLLWEQFADELIQQDSTKFAPWDEHERLGHPADTYFFRTTRRKVFRTDLPRTGLFEGSTVTFVAMQLAYYLGFRVAILIGVDHSFKSQGEAHKVVVAGDVDHDHFDPRYFAGGVRWQLPDLAGSERAYAGARDAWEQDGRKILDATVGGKLTVFPKVEYKAVLEGRKFDR